MKTNKKDNSTNRLVLSGILTALVIILQFLGAFIRFGPFSISLVLIPIVIGAATCGIGVSTWLGLVFGIVVLLSGDAAAFMVVHVFGTIVTVLVKGLAAGLFAGLTYKVVFGLMTRISEKKVQYIKTKSGLCENCEKGVYDYISRYNKYIAVFVAAVVCPVVNTCVFLFGCLIFFMDTIQQWAAGANHGGGVAHYMIFVLVGANFLFELAFNIVLSPIVVRVVQAKEKI